MLRIDGGHQYPYIGSMAKKHRSINRSIKCGEDIIVNYLFDGADHSKSNKKRTSLILFIYMMSTPSIINPEKVKCGSSLNILTWYQLNTTYSYSNMIPSVNECFKEKGKLYDNITNDLSLLHNYWLSYYDVHDGKII